MRLMFLLMTLLTPLTASAQRDLMEECKATYQHFFPHCDLSEPDVRECLKPSLEGLYLRDVLKYQPREGDPSHQAYARYKKTPEYRKRLSELLIDRKSLIGSTLCLPSSELWTAGRKKNRFVRPRNDLAFLSPENYFREFRAEMSISGGLLELQEEAPDHKKVYFFRFLSFFRKSAPVKTALTHVFFCDSWDEGVCENHYQFRVGRRGTIF